MIDVVKGIEPSTGFLPILQVSKQRPPCASAHTQDQDGLYLLRRRLLI